MHLFRTPHFFRWIFPKRMWGFSCPEKKLYLTFDDGPLPEVTEWVLEFLSNEKIHATFFCLGKNVVAHPAIFEKVKAQGHTVGNHTFSHEHGLKVSKDAYLASLEKADKVIQSNLFRPPYGRMPRSYDRDVEHYSIVMWTWLSYDFDPSVSVEKIMKSARHMRNGDILVFHDNERSFERLKILLPQVVQMLKEKGFTFEKIPSV
jgi:peptidoglycan/xylan/chitin deacetylase (PgdA/CDA1 family)